MARGLAGDALHTVLELLDDVELPVAAQVCWLWCEHARAIGARNVVCSGCLLDIGGELHEQALALFEGAGNQTAEAALISACRWRMFRRRHGHLARQLGKLCSMAAFEQDDPELCTAVVCDRGLVLLGPGGAVLQGGAMLTSYGIYGRVRAHEGYLYALQDGVYDGSWVSNVVRWNII